MTKSEKQLREITDIILDAEMKLADLPPQKWREVKSGAYNKIREIVGAYR